MNDNIAAVYFLIVALAVAAGYTRFRKLYKLLNAILVLASLAFLFMIFPFTGILVVGAIFLVGYMVIALLIALFWVSTESVLDKQNPVADFIRASKEAQANKGGQKGG